MKFEVNIDKKYFFILLGAILILAGAIYGYAQPNIFGHSVGEIDVATTYSCANGKYVKSINLETGAVVCESDQVGGEISYVTRSCSTDGCTMTCPTGYSALLVVPEKLRSNHSGDCTTQITWDCILGSNSATCDWQHTCMHSWSMRFRLLCSK